MTYTKYIETGASCFIPGKVLDEVVRILSLVQGSAKATLEGHTSNLPRAHELLQVWVVAVIFGYIIYFFTVVLNCKCYDP